MAKIHKLIAMMFSVVLLAACSDSVKDIEDTNEYMWQRHMNTEEFEQLKEGMTYMEVVEIARGGGEKEKDGKYIWHDEQIMTIAYEITFKDDKLTKKEQVTIQGHSTRDLKDEKEPAKPE
ncbi:MAG: hypothetical protein KIG60_04290 [Caryophanon sp.]|nr:hypothetical protein [Caryophanon sp.]